ncbi:AsmA family protein [bacterium]|nr:AsmA family protein [bacterium]
MKKLLKIIGTLIVTLIVALLVAPMFYSLDELKPNVEEAINKNVRGEVKIGHLSFSLFPSVVVGIQDLELKAPKGSKDDLGKIASVEVRMSLFSLLASPSAILTIDRLELNWIKDEAKGVDNLIAFLPDPSAKSGDDSRKDKAVTEGDVAENAPKGLAEVLAGVPGFVRERILNAKFSFELVNGAVRSDLKMKDGLHLKETMTDMDFELSDFGLNSDVILSGSAEVDMSAMDIVMKGRVAGGGKVNVSVAESTGIVTAKLDVKKDFKDLEIQAMSLMHKKKGAPLGAYAKGSVSYGKGVFADFTEMGFVIADIKTMGSLKVDMPDEGKENIAFKLSGKSIELKSFADLLPMLKEYSFGGSLSFDIGVNGGFEDPAFSGGAQLSALTGSTPELAKPIENGKGTVILAGSLSNPIIQMKDFSINLGKSDMAFNAKVSGIEKIKMSFDLDSKLLDLDELMIPGSEVSATSTSGGSSTGVGASAPAAANASLDQSLTDMAPLIEETLANPMLDQIQVDGKVVFQELRLMGASFKNAGATMALLNRNLSVKSSGMKAYGGKMDATMNLGLKPKAFSYGIDAALDNILVEQALATHAPKWQKDVTGKLRGTFKIGGIGLTKRDLEKNLKGSLKGDLSNGTLNIPVTKIINEFIGSLPEAVKNKAGGRLEQNFNGAFKTAKVDAEIKGRQVSLKTLDVVYDTQKGNLGDMRFNSNGTVNFDKAIDMNATVFVEERIVKVAEWKGPSGLVELPFKLKGTMDEPKPDVGYTSKILLERLAKGAAKKAVQQQVEKVAPKVKEEVQKKGKELLKKFGF